MEMRKLINIINEIDIVPSWQNDVIPTVPPDTIPLISNKTNLSIYPVTEKVIYKSFCVCDSVTRNVVMYLRIKLTPININGVNYHEIHRVYVNPLAAGNHYSKLLYDFVVNEQKLSLISDKLMTPAGMNNTQKLINSENFSISYYNDETNTVAVNQPIEMFTKFPNPWRVLYNPK